METKSINSLAEVTANDTRKMLCGDGVITIAALKAFINSALSASIQTLEAAAQTLQSGVDANLASIATCIARIAAIETSIAELQRLLESVGYSSLLGYVYEEDSEGNLTRIEETGDWHTIKLAEGRYTQKFVTRTDETENESEES